MPPIDWRELYAENQRVIAAAGVPVARDRSPRAPGRSRPSPFAGEPPRGDHVASAGAAVANLTATVHVPRGLDRATPAALVCMLHGCTQDPRAIAVATRMNEAADRHGFVVVYPGQDRANNPQGCWNWFLPAHQQRGAGEPAAIAAMVGDLVAARSDATIDPRRVFVAGLSAGGAMAAVLALCYPDLFAAVAVHSGLAYKSAISTASALEAMQRGPSDDGRLARAAHAAMGRSARPVPSIVIHGSADHTVAPVNALALLRQSMEANQLAAPERARPDPGQPDEIERENGGTGHPYARARWRDVDGALLHELMIVDGLGHAWSGGAAGGSFTDPRGPSATEAILGFFAATASARSSALAK